MLFSDNVRYIMRTIKYYLTSKSIILESFLNSVFMEIDIQEHFRETSSFRYLPRVIELALS